MATIVIIGGMAAGCKAAARLRRLNDNCKIILVEKLPFVSFGACGMPYYVSGDVDGFFDLAKTPWGIIRDAEYFKKAKDVEVLTETEVLSLNPDNNFIICKNLITNETFNLNYDYLVFSIGALPMMPLFPYPVSERISTFHNPYDAKKVREKLQKGEIESVAIIGGGYIGCELAESLAGLWEINTFVIEKENRLLPRCLDKQISNILERRMSDNGCRLILSALVKKIEIEIDGKPFIYIDGMDPIVSDMVFLCLGIKPNAEIAQRAGIITGKHGGIVVNQFMETNIKNIFAGGDCVEIENTITGFNDFIPLGSLANRQGKLIADSISSRLFSTRLKNTTRQETGFKGAVGAASIKVFDLVIGTAGITEKQANELEIKCNAICSVFYDRPHYHPDNRVLYAKIIYEIPTLRLLGLQLAGEGEVTRYIDVFACLLSRSENAYSLLDLEHAYNPPHSSPINPLNYLGSMIIAREIEGIEAINSYTDEYEKFQGQILDLREANEIESELFDDSALCIPFGELRMRVEELDKNIPLLAVCQKGPRAYEAVRYLRYQGFEKVYYLAGGAAMVKKLDG